MVPLDDDLLPPEFPDPDEKAKPEPPVATEDLDLGLPDEMFREETDERELDELFPTVTCKSAEDSDTQGPACLLDRPEKLIKDETVEPGTEPEDEEDEGEDEDEASTKAQGTTPDGQVIEGRIVQEIDFSTMPLEIGHRVHIKPGGLSCRAPALFVGMELNSYLMVRLSGLHAELSEIFPFLYAGNEVKLFFTDKGVLKGFLCTVIAYKASPFRHLYLSYPHKGEFFTLRQQDRYLCHLPAFTDPGKERLHGMIQDLSLGGCSVNLAHPDPESLDLRMDQRLTVGFSLLSAEHVNMALCRVRNLRLEEDMVNLGLSFEGLDKAVMARVTHFIDFLSRYRGTKENSMR